MENFFVLVFGLILTLSLSSAYGEEELRSTPIAAKLISTNNDTYFPKTNLVLPKMLSYFNKALLVYRRRPCVNLEDEGCVNGYIPGAGSDGGYLNGGHNPGK